MDIIYRMFHTDKETELKSILIELEGEKTNKKDTEVLKGMVELKLQLIEDKNTYILSKL